MPFYKLIDQDFLYDPLFSWLFSYLNYLWHIILIMTFPALYVAVLLSFIARCLNKCRVFFAFFCMSAVLYPFSLMAEERHPWQMSFVHPATDHMEDVIFFHNTTVMGILLLVVLCVFALLAWCLWRYHRSRSPVPTRRVHHNLWIEVIWLSVPALLLVLMLPQSLHLIRSSGDHANAEITIKITGNQWYWHYEYPDDGIAFDSLLVEEPHIAKGQIYLLSVDEPLVLPIDTKVRAIITAADVIHSWAMPSFGIKMDAVPGQLNQIAFTVNRVGTFYGQCSELCGLKHAFMPIEVHVLSKDDYHDWLTANKAPSTNNKP